MDGVVFGYNFPLIEMLCQYGVTCWPLFEFFMFCCVLAFDYYLVLGLICEVFCTRDGRTRADAHPSCKNSRPVIRE